MIIRIHALRVRKSTSDCYHFQTFNQFLRHSSVASQIRRRHVIADQKHVKQEDEIDHDSRHGRIDRSPEGMDRKAHALQTWASKRSDREDMTVYQKRGQGRSSRKVWNGNVDIQELEGQHTGISDKPPGIIVLRGKNTTTYERGGEYIEPIESKSIDILAAIKAERGLVSHSQVMQNIEELAPQGDRLLSWEDFSLVERRLHDGFTMQQLTSYIHEYRPQVRNANATDIRSGPGKRTSISRWVPGVSDSIRYFDSSITRGYVAEESMTKKQILVITLMRKCWNIEVKQLVALPGQLEIALDDEVLRLLLSGTVPLLKDISDRYLRTSDSQIVVSRARNVIRITARRDEALDIANAIVQLENRVVQKRVPSPLVGFLQQDGLLSNSEALNELEKLTSTIIKDETGGTRVGTGRTKRSGSMTVFGVEEADAMKRVELMNTVNRLLLTATKSSAMQKRRLVCLETPGTQFDILHNTTTSMPWHLRSQQWTRRSSETRKGDETLSENEAQSGLFFEEFTKAMASQPTNIKDNDVWELASSTATSIMLGHVLHQVKDGVVVNHSRERLSQNAQFLPCVQNSSYLFEQDLEEDARPSMAMVRMRFIPSPYGQHNAKALSIYPEINMQFSIKQVGQQLSLREVTAITNHTATDIMIPDRALDMRIEQRVLWKMKKDVKLAAIDEFLDGSQLSLARGAIVTPPTIVLPISKELCNMTGSKSKTPESLGVEYVFAGLEFRDMFSTQFQGWPLSYTNVDGGSAYGNRVEVVLTTQRLPSLELTPTEAEVLQQERTQDFVEAAFNLLDELEAPERDEPIGRASPPVISTRLGSVGRDFRLLMRPIEFGLRSNHLETGARKEQIMTKKARRVKKERVAETREQISNQNNES